MLYFHGSNFFAQLVIQPWAFLDSFSLDDLIEFEMELYDFLQLTS